MKLFILALCCLCGTATALPLTAATKDSSTTSNQESPGLTAIEGTVYDEAGEPVAGATVMIKGKPATATATDAAGRFSLSGTAPGDMLAITYIGMEPLYTPVEEGKTDYTLTMRYSSSELDEVVVVGYAMQRKASKASPSSRTPLPPQSTVPVPLSESS